jgi:hypothetical protein
MSSPAHAPAGVLGELGWVHARGFLPQEPLQALREQLAAWLAGQGARAPWPWQGIDQQAIRLHRLRPQALGGLQQALGELDAVYALSLLPPLGALLEQHTGWPAAALSPIHNLRAKLPGRLGTSPFTTVPWHQDYGASDPTAGPVTLVTAWIPLSPASPRHGGLELIPRSQRLGWLAHQRGDRGPEVDPLALAKTLEQHPDLKPVAIDAQPGDVVLFDQLTLHRSLPNRSRRTRWSLDLRYSCIGSSTGRPGLWQRDPRIGEPVDEELMALVQQRCTAMANPATPILKRVDLLNSER